MKTELYTSWLGLCARWKLSDAANSDDAVTGFLKQVVAVSANDRGAAATAPADHAARFRRAGEELKYAKVDTRDLVVRSGCLAETINAVAWNDLGALYRDNLGMLPQCALLLQSVLVGRQQSASALNVAEMEELCWAFVAIAEVAIRANGLMRTPGAAQMHLREIQALRYLTLDRLRVCQQMPLVRRINPQHTGNLQLQRLWNAAAVCLGDGLLQPTVLLDCAAALPRPHHPLLTRMVAAVFEDSGAAPAA